MSGIFRSVSLLHQTDPSSDGYRVTPGLDACYRDARLKVELQAASGGAGLSVEANLYDGDERVATLRQRIGTQAIDEGCMTIAELWLTVAAPHKWSAETPTSIADPDPAGRAGKHSRARPMTWAFGRKIRGGLLRVNGQPCLIPRRQSP